MYNVDDYNAGDVAIKQVINHMKVLRGNTVFLNNNKLDKNLVGEKNGVAYLNENKLIPLNEIDGYENIVHTNNLSFISPRQYGAVGNGITDDTDAFKKTISYASTYGKIIYIEKGTYLISDRLIIDAPILIEGASQSDTILQYNNNTYHEEVFHDDDWYDESNACIVIKSNNVEIKNLTIVGGTDKNNPSVSNGIILHYTRTKEDNTRVYTGSERVALTNIDVKYFKCGVFIFGGWNRYITRCHFIDCSVSGIKYYPLEIDTVGNWSASGDVYIACQFIGNSIGFDATAVFETTIWNSVFEYNGNAIKCENCLDMCFKNCWNEANYGNIIVNGNCKFEGGYNIINDTVTHTAISPNDIVQFESGNLITMCREGLVIFNQASGIITKGVEIGFELENLLLNPNFAEDSGGTSTTPSDKNWYHEGSFEIIESIPNYIKLSQSDASTDLYRGLWADKIPINGEKEFIVSAWLKTTDRLKFDSKGELFYLAWKNANGDTILSEHIQVDIIADNTWEYHEWQAIPPSDATYIVVGWGFARNGELFVKSPQLNISDNTERSNVYTKINKNNELQIDFKDINGREIGSIDFETIVPESIDIDFSSYFIQGR